MNRKKPDEALVSAYLQYGWSVVVDRAEPLENPPAWDEVTYTIEGPDSEMAFQLVVALVEKAPNELLNYIAAGPIEDLLCKHGPKVIARVLKTANDSAKMRFALHGVWGQTRMDPDVWRRLQHAIQSWKTIH
jgi:hypothetical protein